MSIAEVPVCGLVSTYNATSLPRGVDRLGLFMSLILTKSLTVRGFIQREFVDDQFAAFLADMSEWVADGRVRYREDVVDGLGEAREAFRGLFTGRNFGKLLVKVAD